ANFCRAALLPYQDFGAKVGYGRGRGVGRARGDGMGLGDGVGLGVAVGVVLGVTVGVVVGVAVALGDGLGVAPPVTSRNAAVIDPQDWKPWKTLTPRPCTKTMRRPTARLAG